MPPVHLLYRLAVGMVRAAAPVLETGSGKVAEGVRGRRRAGEKLIEWGRAGRDSSRPTVWFHAPSVGEGLQAKAVIEALTREMPEVQVVFTHFSPSARMLGESMPAEVSAYLPWDVRSEVSPILDVVAPDLLVFTKTEVWPVLATEAARRGGRTALVAGTLPADAGRLRLPARVLLGPTWRDLDLVCAVGEADALRFRSLGVEEANLNVTGDPGIDSAASRAKAADPDAPYLAPLREDSRPVVVAGSTWSSDERELLPVFVEFADSGRDAIAVIAPHEPSADTVARLHRELTDRKRRVCTLSEMVENGLGECDAVIVDTVGVLAHLYTVADVAYVGGGFHSAGLHSVLEPAAAGVPILFGPRHGNAKAATDLVEAGAARVVNDVGEFADSILEWLSDQEAAHYAGRCGYDYIGAHRGAADRTAGLLQDLICSA